MGELSADRATGAATRPITAPQSGIWLAEQLVGGRSPFTIDRFWSLRGLLVRAALDAAVKQVVARHEALRTAIVAGDSDPVQRVLPGAAAGLELLPEASDAAFAEFFDRPWDLAQPPGLRVALAPGPDADEHRLALRVHHALCDGTSLEIVLRDLADAYARAAAFGEGSDAGSNGGASALPALPTSSGAPTFGDYLSAVERLRGSERGRRAIGHWRSALDPPPEPIALPGGRATRAATGLSGYRGATAAFDVSAEAMARIDALAKASRVTTFPVLLAGVCVLLARIGGAADVTVGVPLPGRMLPEARGVVGMLTGVAPVRVDAGGNRLLGDVIRDLRRELATILEHGWLPPEYALDEGGVPRRGPGEPLFPVIVTYLDERERPPFRLGGVETVERELPAGALARARTDLTVELVRRADGLRCRLEVDAGRYGAPTARRLAGWLGTVLEALSTVPDDASVRVDRVPLLAADERRLVLGMGEGPRRQDADEPTTSALALIERQIAARPDAVAVVGGGGRMSYRALDAESRRIAAALRRSGIARGDRVGVCMRRTPQAVAALLAVWRAGAAYVPLDPAYPSARLRFLIADSRAAMVVTDRASRDVFDGDVGQEVRLFCVDVDDPAENGAGTEDGGDGHQAVRHMSAPAAADLAYVIYTSGSTGVPKGVLVEHGGVANLVRWARDAFAPGTLRRVLASTSFSFDLSVFEIFVPLSTGGTTVLAENLPALLDAAPAAPVTLVNTVPSVLAGFLRESDLPAGVRAVALAGEPLPGKLAAELHARGVHEVYNLYAPSETTVYSTWCALRPGGDASDESDTPDASFTSDPRPPVGRPLDGTRIYVLDDALEPVGVGVAGEIHIGGAGVARGYLGRPAATAASFVPDPFRGVPGARMYRTGDRGRWREDGALEFLGRRDRQVKLRGFRIEPGEVEAALLACSGVEAACCAVRTVAGEPLLVGYVVGGVDRDALRRELAARLPEALVPSRIVTLGALPLSPNGKVDRDALPDPSSSPPLTAGETFNASQPSVISPTGTPEDMVRLVAGAWREVLAGPVVDDRSFFELGGTSLGLVRVRGALRRRGVEVPLTQLFRYATVRSLAEHLKAEHLKQAALGESR